MKINKSTRIIGKKIILVPYRERHVLRYHEWMKSEELQQLTASDPLSLEEEYKMQKSWFEDDDKCTFIIINKCLFDKTNDEANSMIGDTNLFFNHPDNKKAAEIEIMIAELTQRGKGYGWEAVILMLRYGIETLKVEKYSAKISTDNENSLKMFNKLGFKEISKSEVFKEVTLEKEVDNDWLKWIKSQTIEIIQDEKYE